MFNGWMCFLEKLVELHISPSEVCGVVANPSCNVNVNLGQQEFYPGRGACDEYDHFINPFNFLNGERVAFGMELL